MAPDNGAGLEAFKKMRRLSEMGGMRLEFEDHFRPRSRRSLLRQDDERSPRSGGEAGKSQPGHIFDPEARPLAATLFTYEDANGTATV